MHALIQSLSTSGSRVSYLMVVMLVLEVVLVLVALVLLIISSSHCSSYGYSSAG